MTLDTAAIALQLACPHGDRAADFSRTMLFRNLPVYHSAYRCLNICAGNRILEIGYGNGGLLGTILSLAPNLHYTGIERSLAVHQDASRFNQAYITAGKATYLFTEDGSLSFTDASFDRILTVNTIYFWPDPYTILSQITAALAPNGLFCLTFGEKTFMNSLPFTHHGFQLYTPEDILHFTASLPLKLVEMTTHRDQAVGIDNTLIERVCLNMLFKKCTHNTFQTA